MNRVSRKRGFTLVEIMIVVAVIALIAAIATPNLLRARTTGNDVAAKAIIKTIASAAEEYASFNGNYPNSISELTATNPPYLNEDYTNGPRNGYNISCSWSQIGYNCTALPIVNCTTGNKVYTVTAGIVLAEDDAVVAEGTGDDTPEPPTTPPDPPPPSTFGRP